MAAQLFLKPGLRLCEKADTHTWAGEALLGMNRNEQSPGSPGCQGDRLFPAPELNLSRQNMEVLLG